MLDARREASIENRVSSLRPSARLWAYCPIVDADIINQAREVFTKGRKVAGGVRSSRRAHAMDYSTNVCHFGRRASRI